MIEFLFAIFGAVWNRARGGLINKLALNKETWRPEWTAYKHADALPEKYEPLGKRIGKYGNSIAFGAVTGFILNSWLIGVAAIIGMFIGSSFGWGKYVGGIIDDKFDINEEEIKWIDKLVMNKEDNARVRSIIAMSLRGVIWTTSIALALVFWSTAWIWLIPVGLLMGPIYWLGFVVIENDLMLPEWVWGFVLWGAAGLILV